MCLLCSGITAEGLFNHLTDIFGSVPKTNKEQVRKEDSIEMTERNSELFWSFCCVFDLNPSPGGFFSC
jgi:hypothetical protein